MKRLILLLYIVVACKTQNNPAKIPCEKELIEFVSSNWKFLPDSNFYEASRAFYKAIDSTYMPCIRTFSKQQLSSIFGKPSNSNDFGYSYRVGSCKQQSCLSYMFEFDTAGKVNRMSISTSVIQSEE